VAWTINPLVEEVRSLLSENGLGMGFSPGMPLFAYHEPPPKEGNSFSAQLLAFLCCCCNTHSCCVRPVRVWLDTALRYFAFSMAPPVLDGLGAQPNHLAIEAAGSTLVCLGMVLLGLAPFMPHPQRDPAVVHFVLVVLAAAIFLKAAAFFWFYFPSMTGLYPVPGVSLVQWCDCLNYREEAEDMEGEVADGTRAFMERQKTNARNHRQSSNARISTLPSRDASRQPTRQFATPAYGGRQDSRGYAAGPANMRAMC